MSPNFNTTSFSSCAAADSFDISRTAGISSFSSSDEPSDAATTGSFTASAESVLFPVILLINESAAEDI